MSEFRENINDVNNIRRTEQFTQNADFQPKFWNGYMYAIYSNGKIRSKYMSISSIVA